MLLNALEHLRGYLEQYDSSPLTVLQHFLGHRITYAPALLDEAVFVGLDMEWWIHGFYPITEIGISVMRGSELCATPATAAGILDLFKKIEVYHCRLMETAFMTNRQLAGRAAHFFRFGKSRWITKDEGRRLVQEMFSKWKCADGSPAPVIFFGHGLRDDIKNLKLQYGIDIYAIDNAVYTMETLPLAKEAEIIPVDGPKKEGRGRLSALLQGFKIHCPNDCLHNAGNDIGYTAIVALLIGLKEHLFPGCGPGYPPRTLFTDQSLERIIDEYSDFCKSLPAPTWGSESYCYICKTANHSRAECTTTFRPCENCKNASGPANAKHRKHASKHPTECCSRYPEFEYEPLPQWVTEKLSKAQRKEFEQAKALKDKEKLGELVLAAYPAMMMDAQEDTEIGAIDTGYLSEDD